jgi:hypothetical protein
MNLLLIINKPFIGEQKMENNKIENGTFTFSSGDIYEGEYYKGEFVKEYGTHKIYPHGKGKYTTSGNFDYPVVYVGEFRDGKPHGQGYKTYGNGSRFDGEWKDGFPYEGTDTDKDGNITAKYVKGNETDKILN